MYKKKDFVETNIKYTSRDFTSLKANLIEYAKTYFSTTYKDFNETSPGMMLIEMAAYVGDVLNFYIDQQYREMLLPLAEERRNINNLSKMLGYRIKPIVPAYVNLTVKQTLSDGGDGNSPAYGEAITIDEGMKVSATSDSDLIFETLDAVDFTASGSETVDISSTEQDDQGITNEWTLARKVRAISGKTKTKSFTIGSPIKFLELTLIDTDVVDIINVVDTNGNKWYEVEYLAQDRVPVETHYTSNNRNSAYTTITSPTTETLSLPVPYTLEFVKTSKRFIVETNDDNTTSLVFGNGLLRSGQDIESSFIQSEQIGITIPGTTEDLTTSIDPTLGDEYSTLGETPAHTTLTVTYRVGGGISSNVTIGDLTTIELINTSPGSPTDTTGVTVANDEPARGGSDQETVDEIRQRAKAFFTTQNRCVTKKDYEARIMNLPARFGSVAKVYVDRTELAEGIESFVYGCTRSGASNYNSAATVDDGSCLWDVIYGCTHAMAANYNPNATIDDGSCEYPAPANVVANSISYGETGGYIYLTGFLTNNGEVTAYNVSMSSSLNYGCNNGFVNCIDGHGCYFSVLYITSIGPNQSVYFQTENCDAGCYHGTCPPFIPNIYVDWD